MTRISPVSTRIFLAALATILAVQPLLSAQDVKLTREQTKYFENHIRPALVQYCYECHSIKTGRTNGGLLVDSRDGLLQGGDSGPAIEPGNLDDSVLWGAITWSDYEMPPRQKMPAETIAHFKKWIEMGAPDPRVREKLHVDNTIDIDEGRKHWAFQKPVGNASDDIDRFVDARLKEAGLSAGKSATATTLLRRLNFDLIGLPPSPEEVTTFYKAWRKNKQEAVEAKVEELLNSPQFGERWARHWLDVARYAESSGKETNFTYPHAWRYRDYVIAAFNDDKPYSEFIAEQIAGDLLPYDTSEEHQEHLIATGFLALGAKSLSERNPRQFRMDVIDEQIDTTTQAILGITVACARCHDHKFDPIPTTDYYAMAGIFLSTDTRYGTVAGLQNRRPAKLIELPVADSSPLTKTYSQKEMQDMRQEVRDLQRSRFEARRSGRKLEQREIIRSRNAITRIRGLLGTLDRSGVPKTYAMGVQDDRRAMNANVLLRGEVEKPAQQVPRGFLQVMDDIETSDITRFSSGRLQLAEWLTSRDNPQTARVMANRIWMHLFGEGLVRSPNNWGTTGEQPTHPDLLDHLAIRFMDHGWSIKALVRDIVLTETYQRDSKFNQQNFEIDAENRLLWRANARQLDAEALRDSMLAISGRLDLEQPLASVVTTVGNQRVGRQINQSIFDPNDPYRSIYLPVLRNLVPDSLSVFNFPESSATTAKREETNVPSQALYMLNSRFVTTRAHEMATRLVNDYESTNERIRAAFLQAYGRRPSASEVRASTRFFARFDAIAEEAREEQAAVIRRNMAVRSSRNGRRGRAQQQVRDAIQRRIRDKMAEQMQGDDSMMSESRGYFNPRRFFTDAPPKLVGEELTLTLFCQSLLASAEFRILN